MVPLPERVDVLVVGAGPTGMTAALSLHKHGCTNILIVDSVLVGENTSRAMAVHAATLEVCPINLRATQKHGLPARRALTSLDVQINW